MTVQKEYIFYYIAFSMINILSDFGHEIFIGTSGHEIKFLISFRPHKKIVGARKENINFVPPSKIF